jgi:hypothetical protein
MQLGRRARLALLAQVHTLAALVGLGTFLLKNTTTTEVANEKVCNH